MSIIVSCSYLPLYIFFGEVSSQTFCPFLNWIICFLTEFWEVLTFSVYKPFTRYMLYKDLLSVCGLSFHSFKCFWIVEVFNFNGAQFNSFGLCFRCHSYLIKSLHSPGLWKFYPIFFNSRSLVLGYIFRSMMHFESFM